MAKTLRQQLADLAGGKKTNVFYKGLNTDIDEHLIANDQYSDAVNIRLNSKDSDFGTAQNLKSNTKETSLGLNVFKFQPTTTTGKVFWHTDGVLTADQNENLSKITLTFRDSSGNPISFGSNSFIEIGFTIVDFNFGANYQASSFNYTQNDVVLHIYDSLKNNSTFTSVMNVSLGTISNISKEILFVLYFFPVDQTITPLSSDSIIVSSTLDGAAVSVLSGSNTYTSTGFSNSGTAFNIYPISLTSFTDYIVAICYQSASINCVVKIFTNQSGAITSVLPVLISNFGLTSETDSVRVEKIEENENYNRIYWTDGINPIKTVNLEAPGGFYQNFTQEEDFNLFSKSSLKPIEVLSVKDGGSINCGNWSYCYRLKTDDGKTSVVSPITNPTPLPKSSKSTQSHLVEGGLLSDDSGKSVTLKIQNIDTVYSTVQLIGIQYLDEIGGAVFYIIKEEGITGPTANLTHNGNETTSLITAAEVLTKKNTWDVAQDLSVKDNRLFASNLKNNTDEIVSDFNAFRVKSYKHSVGSSAFSTPASGVYSTYSDTFINSNLYDAELYKVAGSNTTDFRYAEGKTATTNLSFGANTTNYHTSNTGVYVTFKLKRFDLNNISYWHSFTGNDAAIVDGVCVPPFVKTFPTGEDSSFNNYKNPVFANKFVGYMRDEVYRFGIQFYDKSGNQSFTYPIGDVRFPSIENDYRFIGTTADSYTTTAGNGTLERPNKYILMDSNGNGYILFPEFRIKLEESIRNKISGFNIVRAERNDSDKRVVAAGMLNQTLIYEDSAQNKELKNKVGLEKLNLFTQKTGEAAFGIADESECYTLETPEVLFNSLSYNVSGEQKLKICNKFLCKSYLTADKPSGTVDKIQVNNTTSDDDVNWMVDSSSAIFYAAPMQVTHATAPDATDLLQGSFFSLYHSDDASNSPLANSDISTHAGHYTKTIFYGQNIGPDELIPSSLLSIGKDFRNRTEIYNQVLSTISTTNNLILDSSSKTMDGGKSLFLNLFDNSFFTFSNSSLFDGTPTIIGGNYYAAKPYAKIIRTLTNSSGQYGGNTQTALVNQRWISTGASLHGDDIKSTEMILNVFGGDTYINMLSISKFHKENYKASSSFRIAQGLIFPVESSVNVDMRRGSYFGKNSANLQVEDEYLLSASYSSANNIKSFPAKDPKIKIVNNYKNLVAASNIKIAGQTEDAFSNFDANEIFEVNMNYGPIENLMSFRNNLYCIQQKAVSILSINSRALIQSKEGSAISIQSALGTGKVIERNDYISTKHGSQNRMNALSTDMGLYWFDYNQASICMISVKQPNIVINLSEKEFCANLLAPIKNKKLNNNPLNVSTTTGLEGGIDISYNPYYNELLFSFSYCDIGTSANTVEYLTVAYNEALDSFVSKRSYNTAINCNHQGYLYSVGYENSSVFSTQTDSARRNIYSHDTNSLSFNTFYETLADNPILTFVNNEEVISLKVYDKISINTEESVANGIFSKFVFNTNVDSSETLNLNTTDIDKVIAGKQIVPVFVSKRQKGNYLKIQLEQTENTSTQDFNLFSTTTYYRKNII